ncbi:MAG: hypothetical protein ACRC6I_13645 [Paracoccaceae bacterium]
MNLAHRLATAALIGLSGATVMLAITGLRPDAALISAAGIGATIAGLPVARLFGHPGRRGVALALLGAVLATAIGASVAGFIVGLASNYLALVIIAPAVVAGAVISSPLAAAAWLVTLGGTHLAIMGWQRLPKG